MAAQLNRRRERIKAGEKPLGWKVGFGAPAAMEKLGIDAPLVGFLTDKALVASGSTISLADWRKPVALNSSVVRAHHGGPQPQRIGNESLQCELADLGVVILAASNGCWPDVVLCQPRGALRLEPRRNLADVMQRGKRDSAGRQQVAQMGRQQLPQRFGDAAYVQAMISNRDAGSSVR